MGNNYSKSVDAAQRLLNVDHSQDWLVSVKEDLTTTVGARGSSYLRSHVNITCHSWIGSDSADVFNRITLVRGRETKVSGENAKGSYTHILVARFRDGGQGLYERQRAFIRIAQAFFCIEGPHILYKLRLSTSDAGQDGDPDTEDHDSGRDLPHFRSKE
jgi:hypothetical protein